MKEILKSLVFGILIMAVLFGVSVLMLSLQMII